MLSHLYISQPLERRISVAHLIAQNIVSLSHNSSPDIFTFILPFIFSLLFVVWPFGRDASGGGAGEEMASVLPPP